MMTLNQPSTQFGPGQQIDGYLLEEFLGRGAFGEVYKAHRPGSPEQKVALKLALTPEGRRLLASESKLAGRVDHPAVVRIKRVSLKSNPPYLVMEYCAGGNLRQRLERAVRLTSLEVEHVLGQILDCLSAAHAAGIAHRDLKPENLLLDAEGQIKVGDFGLGQSSFDDRSMLLSQGMLSQGGDAIGTFDYMAPEQNDGRGDHRVDLYALGVIIFELLTGRRPDRNDRIDTPMTDPAREFWSRLYEQLCTRAHLRMGSAEAMLAYLEQCREAVAPPPPSPRSETVFSAANPPQPARRQPRHHLMREPLEGHPLATMRSGCADTRSLSSADRSEFWLSCESWCT